jgi:hypothetical protein
MGEDADLRSLLEALDLRARDDFRNVLIHDQADRDTIASRLMRYRDQNGDDWADILDMLTMHPEERRKSRSASWRVERRALMPKPRTQPYSRVAWRRSCGRARIAQVADLGRGRG